MLYSGISKANGIGEATLPWAVEYTETVHGNLDAGFAYLNQGHVDNHHRDALAAQLWLRGPRFGKVSVAAGLGPLYYFDTVREANGKPYANHHGLGMIFAAQAQWQVHPRWFVALEANHAIVRRSFDTTALMLGVGYRWDAALATAPTLRDGGDRHEIDLLVGQSVVNSFDAEHGFAASLEYRRTVLPWLDWAVAAIDEGDADLVNRRGIATQLWLTRRVLDDRLTLAAGLGPYFARDRHESMPGDGRRDRVHALLSISASYSLTPRWRVRAIWHRVATGDHRDSDIFLGGIGYGF